MSSSYTKEQETIVLKTLSYKPHQFYQILAVEKTATDGEIKKSYRKLAIKLHPDKNPHPRADEAFKFVNKAWGVLSDPSKKRIFDQTGSDPDSRFSGHSSEGSSTGASPFARGSPFGFQNAGAAPFDDDIFNLFFGGGRGGPTFTFGGDGFTFQTFGGGEHPFMRHRQAQTRQRTRSQQQASGEVPAQPPLRETLSQLLPVLLILIVPILSALFSDSSSAPEYSFHKSKSFSVERKTPKFSIPFYVSDSFIEKKKLSGKQLKNFDSKVENLYIQDRRSKCAREQHIKNEMIDDAQGWFYTDQMKLAEAESLPMPNCQALRNLNLI
ncbi:predicted protein [Scheffersomyces stipitis CBS 6054]|uniref:J domain-containing protein n=1 Tax=Scheffersomyces stipitis (strain ATCC 58785 / CBS 6054 / NBRC 10063 / NRRL Y-11545) TaxID=322104 RepID=A3LYT8_PICST|nr:predicted protein [Scheffersomyces stipitis CBS 6054]ABN68033.2 predicted protein [Scheffersomyces stipitis CBS 6054]KAG2731464.1 hypothetical protein G9P44_005880 [Scheffersomyces stipitis]